MRFDCDVVVIGGGPSGSTAAAALARLGRRVVLLERDAFPRFHIGESLLASVNDVLSAIGAAHLVRESPFPQKWGATFMTPDGGVERVADFAVSSEVPARRRGKCLAISSTNCCCVMQRPVAPTFEKSTGSWTSPSIRTV